MLIIFHLCGDLHQPLHTGYGTDKGGNDIHIKFSGRETNLHRAWDTEIIDSTNISLNDCLALLKGYDKKQIETIKAINVVNWMNSSRVYLNDVYNFTNNTIDKDYCQRNKTIIEKQLVFAGIRLAAILEKTFG